MSTNKKATSIEIRIDLYRSGFICTDMAKKITFKLGSSLVNYFLHQKHDVFTIKKSLVKQGSPSGCT